MYIRDKNVYITKEDIEEACTYSAPFLFLGMRINYFVDKIKSVECDHYIYLKKKHTLKIKVKFEKRF